MNLAENPLRAKATQVHGRGKGESPHIKRIVGFENVKGDDWRGNHFAISEGYAAAYASDTSTVYRYQNPYQYGVVLSSHLSGFKLQADIDGVSLLGVALIEARDNVAKGKGDENSPLPPLNFSTTTDATAKVVFDEFWERQRKGESIASVFRNAGATKQDLKRFLSTGKLDQQIVLYATGVCRTMQNVNVSDLLGVSLVRRWPDFLSDTNDKRSVVRYGNRFLSRLPFDVIAHIQLKKMNPKKEVWYHGTSFYHLTKAFPTLAKEFGRMKKETGVDIDTVMNREEEDSLGEQVLDGLPVGKYVVTPK